MRSETEFASACNVNLFRKGYLGDWSEEIFEISTRLPTVPVTYELRDLLRESIKGRFYEPDIHRVLKSDDERFVVDRLLKTRKRDDTVQICRESCNAVAGIAVHPTLRRQRHVKTTHIVASSSTHESNLLGYPFHVAA